jgi:predicted phage terminase large subunit-like protein
VSFTEALGYVNAGFQREWYEFLQYKFSPLKIGGSDSVKRFLLLWPRGHAKTECTTINYVTWLVGCYPDVHINIVTKTASLAEEILTAIITRFESDDRYIDIFGELKPKDPKKWTSYELIVKRREISKNATIKATGLLGPITGGRSDLIVCDDIIDEENVRTPLQVEKARLWFNKVLYPTLYPWGGIIVVGTRWSYADLYNDLLATWPHDVKQALNTRNEPLWPEYWTKEKLEDRRTQVGSIIFNCQYQNDPTGMEGDLLKSEWLHEWATPPCSVNLKYAGIDPALGEGDLQSVATLSVDKQTGQAYLEDVYAERTSFPEFLKKIQHLHVIHDYAKIFIEANAFQKVLTFLQELSGLPMVTSQTVKNKEERFIPMSSHFESKRILVNPLLNMRSEFWMEWVQFPRGQHDDALDSVEIVTRETVGKHRQGFVLAGK